MNKSISILGCGWLGTALAKALIQEGHIVNGSTTTKEKLDELSAIGINPFLISEQTGIPIHFFQVDVLIICIPPKSNNFKEQFSKIIKAIANSNCERIIFTSSTSVYAQTEGVCLENANLIPLSKNAEHLIFAENELGKLDKKKRVSILRLAGLIGKGRHPGNFFAAKKEIKNPYQVVNLVVLDDIVRLVQQIIKRDTYHLLNVCADQHPTKIEFYTAASKKIGLELPEFEAAAKVSFGRIVSNEKSKLRMQFDYQYGNLMDWLNRSS